MSHIWAGNTYDHSNLPYSLPAEILYESDSESENELPSGYNKNLIPRIVKPNYDRIKFLAQPKTYAYTKVDPPRVASPSVYERLNELAKPKKGNFIKPRKLPLGISEAVLNYVPTPNILQLCQKPLRHQLSTPSQLQEQQTQNVEQSEVKSQGMTLERLNELAKPKRITTRNNPEEKAAETDRRFSLSKRIEKLAQPKKRKTLRFTKKLKNRSKICRASTRWMKEAWRLEVEHKILSGAQKT